MEERDSKSVNQQLYLGIKLRMGIFDIIGVNVSLYFCIVFFYISSVLKGHS